MADAYLMQALNNFVTAIKSLSAGLMNSIMYVTSLFGIHISTNVAALISIIATIYAVSILLKDEVAKKILYFLIAMFVLSYIGLNIHSVIQHIIAFIEVKH